MKMAMSNLEVAKVYLHNQLVSFLSKGGTSLVEFRQENQQVINGMHFTANEQTICFEEAEKAFAAIEEAQRIASIQVRMEVLKGLKGE